jgi:hypothetical protein
MILGFAATAPAGGCAIPGIDSIQPITAYNNGFERLNKFFIILR